MPPLDVLVQFNWAYFVGFGDPDCWLVDPPGTLRAALVDSTQERACRMGLFVIRITEKT